MQPQERSETMQALYPEDLMMKTFGTLYPTSPQRSTYFFNKWCEWKTHSACIKELQPQLRLETLCKQMGLKPLWDFQIRGSQIRFCDAESMAFFKIACSKGDNDV
jgi:hypothetical protein